VVRPTEQALEITHPRLTRGQINTIIQHLMRDQDDEQALEVTAYLLSFYTKRWGLPPAVRSRLTPSPES